MTASERRDPDRPDLDQQDLDQQDLDQQDFNWPDHDRPELDWPELDWPDLDRLDLDRLDLDRRLAAVERAVTDGDLPVVEVADAADLVERVTSLESDLEATTARLDELEAASEATRGYLAGVRAVNREIERLADVALATAERLERRLDGETPTDAGGEAGYGDESCHGSDPDDDDPASLADRLRDLG